jgi:dipeptidyl aminopeptidase/acylaminoacyl peptidase
MQTDLDDGVEALSRDGMVDPERVCIVGASYGGYAALAAGAFSTTRYRCIAAVAPVADLRRMLQDETLDAGRNHWAVRYWESQVGVERYDWNQLDEISPARHAANFTAPVLLIHGDRDTVVPISQSKAMQQALKRAGKEVELVELDGEDHWLTLGGTRIETLRAIAEFVDTNLSPVSD